MNVPTLTTETEILDVVDQEQEVEVPALPLKYYASQEEFDRIVLALRMDYEICKPVGNFF